MFSGAFLFKIIYIKESVIYLVLPLLRYSVQYIHIIISFSNAVFNKHCAGATEASGASTKVFGTSRTSTKVFGNARTPYTTKASF
jgi:hypothetical protein